jgi:hypothetical protein
MRVKAKSGATSSKKPKSRKARKKPRPLQLVDSLLVYAHVARTRLQHAQHHPRDEFGPHSGRLPAGRLFYEGLPVEQSARATSPAWLTLWPPRTSVSGVRLLLQLWQCQMDLLQARPVLARHVLSFSLRELSIEGPGLENPMFLVMGEAGIANDVHGRREIVRRISHDCFSVQFF